MVDQIVRFSRLLRIFELNEQPAFIIELEEKNQKNLYISFSTKEGFRCFESYKETKLKEEFKDLSAHCLMSQCKDATNMFEKSPITHFKADCSNIVIGDSMFRTSYICLIETEFPVLENGILMFSNTKIKEMNIHFPKLKNGCLMFFNSSLEKINAKFTLLENGECMFEYTPLKEITSKFPNLKNKKCMFDNTPSELKRNYPHYFI